MAKIISTIMLCITFWITLVSSWVFAQRFMLVKSAWFQTNMSFIVSGTITALGIILILFLMFSITKIRQEVKA